MPFDKIHNIRLEFACQKNTIEMNLIKRFSRPCICVVIVLSHIKLIIRGLFLGVQKMSRKFEKFQSNFFNFRSSYLITLCQIKRKRLISLEKDMFESFLCQIYIVYKSIAPTSQVYIEKKNTQKFTELHLIVFNHNASISTNSLTYRKKKKRKMYVKI